MPAPITCNHDNQTYACKKLKVRDLLNAHRSFYATPLKKDQDALILKYCKVKKSKRRRPTKNTRKSRDFAIKYNIYANKELIPVCQKLFLSTLAIKRYRVESVMRNFFYIGQIPVEKRGGNQKKTKYARQRQSVHSFIKTLKCTEPHYCRGSSQQRKYLPAELNIKKLYKHFREQNPNSPVKPSYFRTIFNEDFNLGFGSPRTDVCSECIELQERIKTEQNASKKLELMIKKRIHKLKANAFFKLLRERDDNVAILSFDCQKNLVLPKVPDQSCYYSRQLYLYNFTIVYGSSKEPLNKDTTFAYVWTEDQYAKSSNQIMSAVYDRLKKIDMSGKTQVRLMADGCPGQNKNVMMLAMCSRWILDNPQVKKLEIVFPVTGHSFMPPDRVFGNIEKSIRKIEVITSPSEYIDLIREHSTVTKLEDIEVLDWKTAVHDVVKPTAKLHFKISQCKRFLIRRSKKSGNVLVRGEIHYKSDLGMPKSICKKNKIAEMIRPSVIPKGIPVNVLKLRDVRNLIKKHYGENWNELPHLSFFRRVLDGIDEEELQLLEDDRESEINNCDLACEISAEDNNLRI